MFKKTWESLGFHIEMAISYRKIPAIYSAPSPPRVTHPRHPLHQSIRFCSKRIPGRCHRWFSGYLALMSTNFSWGFPRKWPTSYGLASVCLSNICCFLLKSKFINFPQHHLKKAGPKVQKPSCIYNKLHKVHQILQTPTQKKNASRLSCFFQLIKLFKISLQKQMTDRAERCFGQEFGSRTTFVHTSTNSPGTQHSSTKLGPWHSK